MREFEHTDSPEAKKKLEREGGKLEKTGEVFQRMNNKLRLVITDLARSTS